MTSVVSRPGASRVTFPAWLVAAALAIGWTVAAAAPAQAHAALIATTPANNEIVAASPAEATLTFGEAVGIGLGSLRVFDADGNRVDAGTATRSDDDRVVHVPLRPALADGSYVVVWRVVSADSHPVSGTFTFSVGAPSTLPAGYLGRIQPPRSPSLLLGLTRFAGFGSLLVFLGAAFFCALLWPAGARARPIRWVVAGAGAVCLASSLAALLLQGPYAAGLPASRALDRELLDSVLETTYGTATAARISALLLGLLLAAGLWWMKDASSRIVRGTWWLIVATGVTACVSYAAAGHGGAGSLQPWTFLADATHVVAVSVWIGGLAVLGFGLRGVWREAEADHLLPRWSRLATYAVVVLVASGTFAAWREVRSLSALASTAYGGVLVAKLSLVAFMLLLGAVSRSVVKRRANPQDDDAEQLRRTTLVETITAVLVVAVTAVLVQTPPAATAYAPPYTGISTAGPYRVQVDVYPAHKGINGLHIYTLNEDGRTEDVEEITGSLVRADGDTITVHPAHKSLGHYEDLDVVLPSTGSYTLNLQVRVNDIDSYPTSQTLTVR